MAMARGIPKASGFVRLLVFAGMLASASAAGEQTPPSATAVQGYDQLLDLYVRDGFVYYRTLKGDRPRLDRYVASLAGASIDNAPAAQRAAFWLNAYNALVLKTVIDRFPIPQRSKEYPAASIRQIPGAFERERHRVAGRTVTLDEIERTLLPPFGDPRVFLALGRGAVGGGRLRSEAYTAEALDRQLGEVARECARRAQCLQVDQTGNRVMATAVFSWREQEFRAAYAAGAPPAFSTRSPIEQAILAFVWPDLLSAERAFVTENGFELRFMPFDWNLNDLAARSTR
jgi:hypothetical protein